jgi:putative membrane protein
MQARFALIVLVVLHTVGLVGLNWDRFRPDFIPLIWINLLFVFSIVLSLHSRWNVSYGIYVGAVFLLGMVTEIVGVKTHAIFGAYEYGPVLGAGIGTVPFVIGLNWVVVTYGAGSISKRIDPSLFWRVVFGALLMVGLDALIEPFAIRYGMWTWSGGHPPLRNYLGWFAVGAVAQWFYHRYASHSSNPVAAASFVILVVFFALDLLLANIL